MCERPGTCTPGGTLARGMPPQFRQGDGAGVCVLAHADDRDRGAGPPACARCSRNLRGLHRCSARPGYVRAGYTFPHSKPKRVGVLPARLAGITAAVAWKTNSGLVQASEITRGHDVCSARPWVYGFQFPEHFLNFGAAPFHPRTPAMQRIADELTRKYASSSPAPASSRRTGGISLVRRKEVHLTLPLSHTNTATCTSSDLG